MRLVKPPPADVFSLLRVKKWFAFFPVIIDYEDGSEEIRWMEFVTVEQTNGIFGWENVQFIDGEAMRIEKRIPNINEKRIRSWFSWFPVTIRDDDSVVTKWLCWVTVEQSFCLSSEYTTKWFNIRFIETEAKR